MANRPCRVCGLPTEPSRTGRPPEHCSDACKQRSYRQRVAEERAELRRQLEVRATAQATAEGPVDLSPQVMEALQLAKDPALARALQAAGRTARQRYDELVEVLESALE